MRKIGSHVSTDGFNGRRVTTQEISIRYFLFLLRWYNGSWSFLAFCTVPAFPYLFAENYSLLVLMVEICFVSLETAMKIRAACTAYLFNLVPWDTVRNVVPQFYCIQNCLLRLIEHASYARWLCGLFWPIWHQMVYPTVQRRSKVLRDGGRHKSVGGALPSLTWHK